MQQGSLSQTKAALQVKCGSCTQVINVPAQILPQLVERQQFRCPYCHSIQNVSLSPEVAHQIISQHQDQQKRHTAVAKQSQQQPDWQNQARPFTQGHHEPATLNRVADTAGGSSLQYHVPGGRVQTGSGDDLNLADARSSGEWGSLGMQQHRHESDIFTYKSSQRETDRQMLADVWQQSMHDDDEGNVANRNGYDSHQGRQGLPAVALPEEDEAEEEHQAGDTFMDYVPSKLHVGCAHPDPVVETASLAAVEPPDINYQMHLDDLIEHKLLSGLQLESIVYACQRHQQLLPDESRAGFFIGDGAGVGKGRTIAGLVVENWRSGRQKHMWVSIGSDLRIDTRRDLDDVGATHIAVHPLNKLPYGPLNSAKVGLEKGVIFLTYSSLTSSSDKGDTRLQQLVDWAGTDYDGLIIFDECHKAKNLIPEAGSKPTKVGQAVLGLQRALPGARVVYCSATGASEPRNLGYMERLGLWGPGVPSFTNFQSFLEAVGGRGMGALELIAMDMKARGMYVCRTLSFAGAEFEVVEAGLEEQMAEQYTAAASMWNQLRREFLYAAEQAGMAERDAGLPKKRGSLLWRSFWASHQRFFRHMCMAAKIPCLVRMSKAALEEGKCVVIGLQSTGEARTADVVAERGEFLDDYVSGPRELLLRLVEDYYPLPSNPSQDAPTCPTAQASQAPTHSQLNGSATLPSSKSGRSAVKLDKKRKRGKAVMEVVSPRSRRTKKSVKAGKGVEEVAVKAHMTSDVIPEADSGLNCQHEIVNSPLTALAPEDDAAEHQMQPQSLMHALDEDVLGSPDSCLESQRLAGFAGEEDEFWAPTLQSPPVKQKEKALLDDGHNGFIKRQKKSIPAGSRQDSLTHPANLSHRIKADAADKPIVITLDYDEVDDDEPIIVKVETAGELEQQMAAEARQEIGRLQKEQLQAKFDQSAHRKDQVKKAIAVMGLPANPLDSLIDQLGGPDHVAEMTGRKARLVRQQGGLTGVKWEARNASGVAASATLDLINVHERQMFLNLEKRIAIISEAASAGISLHADRRAKNQQRRVHLTLELPWSADKAIQQFGRSHRANQAHPPQYRLLFTPLGGERRFAAAVARRLESLGALTQGDRRAGPSLTAFNYESRWGQLALKATYRAIMEEEGVPVMPPCCRPTLTGGVAMTLQHFLGQARAHLLNVGIIRPREDITATAINAFLSRQEGAPPSVGKIADPDKIDVARFLNRLLGLAPEAQGQIFDLYQAVLEASIQRARKEGKYDEGIVDVKGTAITLAQPPQVIRRDDSTGAPTLLFRVHVDRGVSWDMAQNLLQVALAPLQPPPAVPAFAATAQEAAGGGPQPPGQGPAGPSQSPGEMRKPKQKLKIRFGGEVVTTNGGNNPGRISRDPDPSLPSSSPSLVDTGLLDSSLPSPVTDTGLPASFRTSAVTDTGLACPSPPPIPDSTLDSSPDSSPAPLETQLSSISDLLQLQDMKKQTELQPSAAAGAPLEPMHTHRTPGNSIQHPHYDSFQSCHPSIAPMLQPSVVEPTAVATAHPPFTAHEQFAQPASTSSLGFHGALGTGTALEAVLGAPSKARPGPIPSVSGYYRPERGAVRGLLLALEAQGRGQVAVYRPATGPAARPMRVHELTQKYVKVDPSEAELQWQHQYAATKDKPEKGVGAKGGWRVRELVLIGGLVLPIWGMVERALVKQHRPADRRMHVIRLQTTGEDARRLVGMLLPKGAVDDLLEELQNQQLAAEAQQAQHTQEPHQPYLSAHDGLHAQAIQTTTFEHASHDFRGTDPNQQVADLQARLQNGFANGGRHTKRLASGVKQAY